MTGMDGCLRFRDAVFCNLAAGDPGQSRLQQEGLVLDVGNETHQL